MNQKKYEDHLSLGTLLSFHLSPGEEFSDQQGRDNDVGSESTISVDTSGTKNPETVSENPSFPTDQEISELPYSEEKSRSPRFRLVQDYCVLNCVLKRKL